MASITSSENPPDCKGGSEQPSGPWYAPGIKAGLEGAVLTLAGCGAVHAGLVAPEHRAAACKALAIAWGACTAGTLALAYGQRKSSRWFWRAFGFGVLIRVGVLGVLMSSTWTKPLGEAGATLGAYVMGLAGMMLVEFRHLIRRTT